MCKVSRMRRPVLLLIAALALCAFQAPTHPCDGRRRCADVDDTVTVLLQGVVDHVEWDRPDAVIHLDVAKTSPVQTPTGSWRVRGLASNALMRAGFTPDTLKMGSQIIVKGRRLKGDECAEGVCQLQALEVYPLCRRILGIGLSANAQTCSDIHESLPPRWTR